MQRLQRRRRQAQQLDLPDRDVRPSVPRRLRAEHPLTRAPRPQKAAARLADIRWWTFAGGRINHTLKHAIEWQEPAWKVVNDNFMLRLEGPGATHAALLALIDGKLAKPVFWDDDTTRQALLARLPNYRLSKFQPTLPDWAAAEMVGAYLLDFEGASEVART